MLEPARKPLSLWLCVQFMPNQIWLDVVCISVSSWLRFSLSLGMIILAFLWMLAQFLSWEQQAKETSHKHHFVLGVILLINCLLQCPVIPESGTAEFTHLALGHGEFVTACTVSCETRLILLSFPSPEKSAESVLSYHSNLYQKFNKTELCINILCYYLESVVC